MMELKFRAWHKPNKIMLDVIAINFSLMQITADIENRKIYPELDHWWKETDIPFSEIVLMQSTGLKDKSGKEIYEGDIVRWKDLESFDDFPIDEVLKVEYSDEFMKWITCNKNDLQDDLYDFTDNRDLEVIGNIYENPELVEEQTIIKEVE